MCVDVTCPQISTKESHSETEDSGAEGADDTSSIVDGHLRNGDGNNARFCFKDAKKPRTIFFRDPQQSAVLLCFVLVALTFLRPPRPPPRRRRRRSAAKADDEGF
uniref:(northern house mosquito) hypothetical protein n=1 Tax=Culex pipiens TaxID=7175 RepID=A0A8D8F852_CULPI